MTITLKESEENLTWNQAQLLATLGHMPLERWEEYRRRWFEIHGRKHGEPGLLGSVRTLLVGRTYQTRGVTTYNEARERGSDHAAEKRGAP